MRYFVSILILAFAGHVFAAEDPVAGESSAEGPEAAMEALVQRALSTTLKALEQYATFYPFGLVKDEKDRVHLLKFSGAESDRPEPDAYAYELLWLIREMTAQNPSMQVAVVVRPVRVVDDEGKAVPAVHMLVDHRHFDARSLLVPFNKREDGGYVVGDLSLSSTQDFLFMAGAAAPRASEKSNAQ